MKSLEGDHLRLMPCTTVGFKHQPTTATDVVWKQHKLLEQ
jgi:hypothetical protein